jgi:hypothetical protein
MSTFKSKFIERGGKMERDRAADRIAILALPAAGALFLTGVGARGPFAIPSAGAQAFIERATSPQYGVCYVLITCAAALSTVGYFALRQRLAGRLAMAAMALSVFGMVSLVPLFGVSGVAYPALGRIAAGAPAALTAATYALESKTTLVLLGFATLGWVGHILFAVAAWRSGWVPRMAVPPFAISVILMSLPTIYPAEIAGCALYLIASALIARAALAGDARLGDAVPAQLGA